VARDEALLDMEDRIAALDARLFASERAARRTAVEMSTLRATLENMEEAQEAISLDMGQMRKELKAFVQRSEDNQLNVVNVAIKEARNAVHEAFARRPEKSSPKAPRTRRGSESPSFEPIHESDKEESGFEESEGAFPSGIESAGDLEKDDDAMSIAESTQGMENAPRVLKIDFFNSKELEMRM
jgi:hypothetical protein